MVASTILRTVINIFDDNLTVRFDTENDAS